MGFRKPKKAIGLDIGTHAVKAVVMSRSMGHLRVEQACCVPVDRNQMNTDPVLAQSLAVREVLSMCRKGRAWSWRRLPARPLLSAILDWWMCRATSSPAVEREASNNIPYDLNDVYMDWFVLDEYKEEAGA